MKKILIDCSLTGGRGPAKKTAEFIWECEAQNIPYSLLTDKKLSPILKKLSLKPNIIINTDLTENNQIIYQKFSQRLKKIDFGLLVKFGARTTGPYIAQQLGCPYIIIDGGLPDKYENYPSLYDKNSYIQARQYILTTNFPWKTNYPKFLKNISLGYFPISTKTKKYLSKLQQTPSSKILTQIKKYFTPIPKNSNLSINLNMTNDYVQPKSRTTYQAWLTNRQYDQVVGFLRRLVTDLAILCQDKKITLFLDSDVSQVCLDLYQKYPNITPVTWKNQWNYYSEIALNAISDITISRAANYQPFVFALARGNSITSAVPADGYMNEDTAAIQANNQKLTFNLPYDDKNYVKKLLSFYQNLKLQKQLAKNQAQNFSTFGQKNNTINLIIKLLKSVT